MNIWQKLPKPIIGLSPMDGVTDAPFRFITAKYGKPQIIMTEFVSVDGLYHGAETVYADLMYHEIERPIIAQVFGNDPKLFYDSAQIMCELGFDGIDINMGCPAKTVSSRGAGAGLIKTPDLAQQIIAATKQGVSDWVKNGPDLRLKITNALERTKANLLANGVILPQERNLIPVSVKTRIGYDTNILEEWLEVLLAEKPANISVHGRLLKQMYSGQANWEAIKAGSKVIQSYNSDKSVEDKITYLGNGDIASYDQIAEYCDRYEVDGVLVGRATLGNPWFFQNETPELSDKFKVILEHIALHERQKPSQAFVQVRKHLAWYIKAIPQASAMRQKLVQVKTSQEVQEILTNYLDNSSPS